MVTIITRCTLDVLATAFPRVELLGRAVSSTTMTIPYVCRRFPKPFLSTLPLQHFNIAWCLSTILQNEVVVPHIGDLVSPSENNDSYEQRRKSRPSCAIVCCLWKDTHTRVELGLPWLAWLQRYECYQEDIFVQPLTPIYR